LAEGKKRQGTHALMETLRKNRIHKRSYLNDIRFVVDTGSLSEKGISGRKTAEGVELDLKSMGGGRRWERPWEPL